MLHGQTMFWYEFDTLASAAAFPWTTPSSWVWLLRYFKAFPLGSRYILKSGTFCYLMRSFGSWFFQHTFPSCCIREASSVASFFLSWRQRCWEEFLIYHYRFFFSIDSIQHGATGRSLRACYRYTNLCGGDLAVYGSGSVRKLWLAWWCA